MEYLTFGEAAGSTCPPLVLSVVTGSHEAAEAGTPMAEIATSGCCLRASPTA